VKRLSAKTTRGLLTRSLPDLQGSTSAWEGSLSKSQYNGPIDHREEERHGVDDSKAKKELKEQNSTTFPPARRP